MKIAVLGVLVYIIGAASILSLREQSPSNILYRSPEASIVIDREGFANGYSTVKLQPLWVGYQLTSNKVVTKICDRSIDTFKQDKYAQSSLPSDYTRSGYDRGHIAPAGDMTWSTNAMKNAYFMTNMSPQVPDFNRGIWKDLESKVRDFAVAEGSIYVYTGPIFTTNNCRTVIGRSCSIEVPEAYYKVILSEKEPRTMIGFILRNEGSTNSLPSFIVTVDEVERRTGLDFFSELPDEDEVALESTVVTNRWF